MKFCPLIRVQINFQKLCDQIPFNKTQLNPKMNEQDMKFDIESMPFFPVKKESGHHHSAGQFLTSSYFKRKNYNSHQTPERYEMAHPT